MSKKKRPEYVKIVCQKTLDRIEEELIKPEKKLSLEDIKNGNCDVTKDFLLEIKDEIKDMMLILDKNKYQPSYIYPLIENFRKKHNVTLKILVEQKNGDFYEGFDQFYNKAKISSQNDITKEWLEVSEYEIKPDANYAKI